MNTSCTVLVLGARGRFGAAAARAFAAAGWRVLAQVRPAAGDLPALAGVEWLRAEPSDTRTLAQAAAGACVVVQALSPAYTQAAWRAEVPRLTDAAIAVTRELEALLMLPANVYNFGAAMPPQLREDTPQHPSTLKGRLRVESERSIAQATADGRMKAVVIRGGDFFGSGRGSWLDLMIAKDLPRGGMSYPGPQDVPTAWAYLPDMARSFVRVAEQRERLPAFETLHFAGYSLTRQDWAGVLQAIAHEQGWLPQARALPVAGVPWPLLRIMGLVVPTLGAVCEMRYLWTTPHALVDERMEALIGPQPSTPFAVAVRQAMSELMPDEMAGTRARPTPAVEAAG
jgi:nucleoside-diphosphate-sugar epimerase